jgi:hypothetical protein
VTSDVDDPTRHPLFAVSDEYAVSAWHNVFVAYFPDRVTVPALEAVHAANLALLRDHPAGTTALTLLRAGMPMPRSDARAYAAKIGREVTGRLRGECIIIDGHPLWARMARTVLYTVELVATPLHPRAVFDSASASYPWVLQKAGHSEAHVARLAAFAVALVAANRRASDPAGA